MKCITFGAFLPQSFPSWWIWRAGSHPPLWGSWCLTSCLPSGFGLWCPPRSRRSPWAPAASAAGHCAAFWWRGPLGRGPSSHASWGSWGLCSAWYSQGSYIHRVSTNKNTHTDTDLSYAYKYHTKSFLCQFSCSFVSYKLKHYQLKLQRMNMRKWSLRFKGF